MCHDARSPSTTLLEMDRPETGVCNEGSTCVWMVGKETVGAARAYWWIKQPSLLVVCVSRPETTPALIYIPA